MYSEVGLEKQQNRAFTGFQNVGVIDGPRFVLHHRNIFKDRYLKTSFWGLC